MRCLKAVLIALFQCQLYIPILSSVPCTPGPPPPLLNLTYLVQDPNLDSTHWNPKFFGDWRYDGDICVRVYCDRTSKNPLDPNIVVAVLDEVIYKLAPNPPEASFTEQSWSGYDPTGRPVFVLRIAEWEKRRGLLTNFDVQYAIGALLEYWSRPPYEQSDFVIYQDGVGIVGGGSGETTTPDHDRYKRCLS